MSDKPRPSGWLIHHIPPAVAAAAGGGCSRSELAAALNTREDKTFDASLWVCYRQRSVDFCDGYVVAPAGTPGELLRPAGGRAPGRDAGFRH